MKGLACKHHPRVERESKSKCFAARSRVFSLLASQAIKEYGFCCFLVPRRQIDPGNNSCYFFFEQGDYYLTWRSQIMDGCRLTLIFTLEIHKKESDRPQAVVLSFLRATHGSRRASAKVKVCKLTFRPRSSQLRSSVLSICCDSKGKKRLPLV